MRDLKTDADDVANVYESWKGSEWVSYFESPSALMKIGEQDARERIVEESPARTYLPGFVPVGAAKPLIDRDEVWVH